jgi:DNA repair protein RecN (Recombination protein N)
LPAGLPLQSIDPTTASTMLTSLYVRHFAVVEAAEIAFGPGLTVVSGETGAGKSLLVDALMLLAGARADSGMVRAGSDRAELAAEFDLAELPEARDWLQREELDEDGSCQLRRVIRAEGSSKAWINGRPANARQLGELASLLVEIHGQHEHQALLSRSHQMALLDAYAGHDALLAQVRDSALQWRELGARMRKLSGGETIVSSASSCCATNWANWKNGRCHAELTELEASHKRLANAGRLAEGAAGVVELLDGESEFALRRALGRAHAELGKLAALDDKLAPLLNCSTTPPSSSAKPPMAWAATRRMSISIRALYAKWTIIWVACTNCRAGIGYRSPNCTTRLEACARSWPNSKAPATRLEKLAASASACSTIRSAAANSARHERAPPVVGTEVSALMAELGMTGGLLRIELEPVAGDEPDPQGRSAANCWSAPTPASHRGHCARWLPAANWHASAWPSKSPRWARTPSAA